MPAAAYIMHCLNPRAEQSPFRDSDFAGNGE